MGDQMDHSAAVDIEKLKEALKHAILLIESYQSDIRNSEWTGVDLFQQGFCQGYAYAQALPFIRRLQGEALGVPVPERYQKDTWDVETGESWQWTTRYEGRKK